MGKYKSLTPRVIKPCMTQLLNIQQLLGSLVQAILRFPRFLI